MTRTLRAALVPHAPSLLASGFENQFGELRVAVEAIRRELEARKPQLLVISSSGHLSVGPIRLLAGGLFQGRFGGGSVPVHEFAYPGGSDEFVRGLVRRLRLAGLDAELGLGEELDSAAAISLRLVLPTGGAAILPLAVPPAALRFGFRFGAALAEMLAERELDAFWLACGALSHRMSKDAESIPEDGEIFDREILAALSSGEIDSIIDLPPRRLARAAADAGLAHLVPLLGFLGEGFRAEVLAYGGIFGAGSAVLAFRGGERPTGEFAAVAGAVSGSPA